MKTADLFEMALPVPSDLKDKRLRSVLTPENIKDHYELVIRLIGGKYSISDIDEIMATITDTLLPKDEIEFQLQLIGKRLPKATNPRRRDHGVFEAWYGRFVNPLTFIDSKHTINRFYEIGYKKGKWFVFFAVDDAGFTDKNKKFDTPEEALGYFEKTYPKLEANPMKW